MGEKFQRASIIAGVMIALIILANYQISRSIEDIRRRAREQQAQSTALRQLREKTGPRPAAKPRRPWKQTDPDELKKYGITLMPRAMTPSTPEAWQDYVETNLAESKVLETTQGQAMVDMMKVSETEYAEKAGELQKHVDIIQQRIAEDPFNEHHKEQLQNIYKLQAVGRALRGRVAVSDDEFISDENP